MKLTLIINLKRGKNEKNIFLLSIGIMGFSKISFSINNNTVINRENKKIQQMEKISEKSEKKSIFSKLKNRNKKEWRLVWSDEFDENQLDTSKWAYWENGNPSSQGNYLDENGNLVNDYGFNAKQYYLRDNVEVQNGNLVITIKKEENKMVLKNGKERKILYSSGAIHTRNIYNVKYGKIEMRASMPQGAGTWPCNFGCGRQSIIRYLEFGQMERSI